METEAINFREIVSLVSNLRTHFNEGLTRPLVYRQEQLEAIGCFLKENQQAIIKALFDDLAKPQIESLYEIAAVKMELQEIKKKLPKWLKTKKVKTNLLFQPGKSYISPEPLGLVYVISPWNFPLQLSLIPMIGAIAAGNVVVLKPSEVSANMSRLFAEKLPNYLDKKSFQVLCGGAEETQALLQQRADHILYTGNGRVGRLIMKAAAEHLTPVTLELGGKSPCLVDKDCCLETTVRRIALGKFSNAGQICIAPDYVLVDEAIEDDFLRKMRETIEAFYGKDPKSSPDYGRIINDSHFQRLAALLQGSGEVYSGGEVEVKTRYIAPTLLHKLSFDSKIMEDEIFGPILPVIAVKSMDEAIKLVNQRSKPLSLYVFSSSSSCHEKVIANTSSGSVGINQCLLQPLVSELPFGGVGASGMGAYRGETSFETFSHYKSIFQKRIWPDMMALLYPPYGSMLKALIQKLY